MIPRQCLTGTGLLVLQGYVILNFLEFLTWIFKRGFSASAISRGVMFVGPILVCIRLLSVLFPPNNRLIPVKGQ